MLLVKTGAPSSVMCKTCTMFLLLCVDMQYFLRIVDIAFCDSVMLTAFKCLLAYSFCASIITNVESLTDTVDSATPISSRKDFAEAAIVVFVSAISEVKRS